MLRQPFNYCATRQTLDGLRGKLLNQVGVYSVIRGFPDRESLPPEPLYRWFGRLDDLACVAGWTEALRFNIQIYDCRTIRTRPRGYTP